MELVARGGFPLALARTEAARARWFDDYLALCLERDLMEEGRVRQPAALAPLLARLASQTAQVLNMSSAGRAVGLAASTASDYVKLFEAAFLGQDPALGDRFASQTPHGGLGSGCKAAAPPSRQVVRPGPGSPSTVRTSA